MALQIIGEHPLATDENGRLKSRIGTLFPRDNVMVTLPGVHATQKLAYLQQVNARRQAAGQAPLTDEEELACYENAVDLIMEPRVVFIRPNPGNMELAFQADDILQDIVPKHRILYLYLQNPAVRLALKQRGECWRINPLPLTPPMMKQMIHNARIGIGGREIYYYSKATGTRLLTCQQFAGLGNLPTPELAQHLAEITTYARRKNALGYHEVVFFAAAPGFNVSAFDACDFLQAGEADVRGAFERLRQQFREAVRPDLREDNPDDLEWRSPMVAALIGLREEVITEETLLGLSSEFFMQIVWLPGARLENGELIFDTVFELAERNPDESELRALCDDKVKGFIFNYLRAYGDVDYINIGRVVASLARREPGGGRRDVYIAEVKPRREPQPIVRIIRMQKWGIREHLDEMKDLLPAIMEAEEYTDYILDRRLGCRQLGMRLPPAIATHKISERYYGLHAKYNGQLIWSPYFERDYLIGIATDKIPYSKYAQPAYALRLARLLGAAAATNLIVGRGNRERPVLFDDGDEVIVEDPQGLPDELIVADHTGSFNDYRNPLEHWAAEYARPVTRRFPHLADPAAFAEAYLAAFTGNFMAVQEEYRKRRRGFDTLFRHRPRSEEGSFAFRWEMVLQRLNAADGPRLADAIRRQIGL